MLPRVRLESSGDRVDASFALALPLAHSIDLGRAVDALRDIARYGDTAHLVDVTATNPFGWGFIAELGIDRANGATRAGCLGDVPDQSFVTGVLIPTYLESLAAGQPVVHRIAAIANRVFLSYRRLTVPIRRPFGTGAPSHLVLLTHIEFAIPHASGEPLSSRERQCLSLAATGRGTKQIAANLGVALKTVEFHLAGARRKLGARTTAQCVASALLAALAEDRS